MEVALQRKKPDREYEHMVDGEAEAHRLSRRLEIHYTPKQGSWLNMAEIELSALARQCLDRRIPDQNLLEIEVQAWTKERMIKLLK